MKIKPKNKKESDLLKCCMHLKKAMVILKDKFNQKEFIEQIKNKFPSIKLSPTNFNRHLNLDNHGDFKDVREMTYNKINGVADEIIKNEFFKIWDKKLNLFKQLKKGSSNLTSPNPVIPIKRFEGFTGTWYGFSWNKSESDKSNEPWLNVLIIKIDSNGNIKCETENAKFTGYINIISADDIITIELKAKNRRIYAIGKIGERSHEELNTIPVGYVDTSHGIVSTGLSIILRNYAKAKDIKKIGSYPNSTLGIGIEIIEQLKDTQKFVPVSKP